MAPRMKIHRLRSVCLEGCARSRGGEADTLGSRALPKPEREVGSQRLHTRSFTEPIKGEVHQSFEVIEHRNRHPCRLDPFEETLVNMLCHTAGGDARAQASEPTHIPVLYQRATLFRQAPASVRFGCRGREPAASAPSPAGPLAGRPGPRGRCHRHLRLRGATRGLPAASAAVEGPSKATACAAQLLGERDKPLRQRFRGAGVPRRTDGSASRHA